MKYFSITFEPSAYGVLCVWDSSPQRIGKWTMEHLNGSSKRTSDFGTNPVPKSLLFQVKVTSDKLRGLPPVRMCNQHDIRPTEKIQLKNN